MIYDRRISPWALDLSLALQLRLPTAPRELLGWNPDTKQILHIQYDPRAAERMRATPLETVRFQQLLDATRLDTDSDGVSETLLVEGDAGRVAFSLSPEGRWRRADYNAPSPTEVVEELRRRVSMTVPHSSGSIVTRTPAEFSYQTPRMFVGLPDGDNDGKPERLDVRERKVLLSSGKAQPFPYPFKAGEQFFVAELDSVSPAEILYARLADNARRDGFQVSVYRLQQGQLRHVATHSLALTHYRALAVIDLDGDGCAELVSQDVERGEPRWVVWRYASGAFQEQAARRPTPLKRVEEAQQVYIGQQAIIAQTNHTVSELRLRLSPIRDSERGAANVIDFGGSSPQLRKAVLLAHLPDGESRANPNQWQTLALDGRLLWYGDCDNDGVEEYVITFPEGGTIAQFRAGQWRAHPISRGNPLVAAFPALRRQKPCLILVYQDGTVDAVRLDSQ